jgi:multicomponent Na+:H+ antiporter subunit C
MTLLVQGLAPVAALSPALTPALPTGPTLEPSITLVVVAAVLSAVGAYLLVERSLVRVLLGAMLLGNGISVLFLVVAGPAGAPAFFGARPPSEMTDPLPQAMVLTAIVISLATVGFLLALAHRQWQLSGSDDVPDDDEDTELLTLAERDEPSATFDPGVESTTTSDELAGAAAVAAEGDDG